MGSGDSVVVTVAVSSDSVVVGAAAEKQSLCVRGAQINVRANPPRLRPKPHAEAAAEPSAKRQRQEDDSELVDFETFQVPRLPASAGPPRQTLRISAGRAAAAAGLHPWTDVGDLFLEFVYQDLPDLLLRDALLANVQVFSPAAERARLMAKSGEMSALDAALRSSAEGDWLCTVRESREALGRTIDAAQQRGNLTTEEAAELRQMLEQELNLEFGARHEDAAIRAYETQVGSSVFGEQRRVSMGFPDCDPKEALKRVLPPLRREPLPRDEVATESERATNVDKQGTAGEDADGEEHLFRLTGFVDGLVDLPRKEGQDGSPNQTLVMEMKHRMGKIKEPPNLYDIVQLCCYCRYFGLEQGHLVQCLRERDLATAGCSVGRLAVTTLDFSEGSDDRKGWDQNVLPCLYKVAAAVYEVRRDEALRLHLLAAPTIEARKALVGQLCPHLV